MPLYEYECRKCGKIFTFLVGVIADNTRPQCPACQSRRLRKLISRVSRLRGEEESLDRMAEAAENIDQNDPKAVLSFARRMAKDLSAETGEDMSDEFEAMMEEEMKGHGDGEWAKGTDDTIY